MQAIINRSICLLTILFFQSISSSKAQIIIAMQDFENIPAKPQATFVIEGGKSYSSLSALNDRPALSPFCRTGNVAHGVNNGTAVLTSTTDLDAGQFSAVSISLSLASFSIGSASEGADGADLLLLEISTDGGNSWSQELEVNGNSNASWGYSNKTASCLFDGDNAPEIFAAKGGNRFTDGYSLLHITDVPPSCRLRIRITLTNNSNAELWVIDDLIVRGSPLVPQQHSIESGDSAFSGICDPDCFIRPDKALKDCADSSMDLSLFNSINCAENATTGLPGSNPIASNIFPAAEVNSDFTVETLSPNPIAGQMKVEFTLPEAGEIHISLRDMRGNQLFENSFSAIPGSNRLEFDEPAELHPGIYIQQLSAGNKVISRKVIKE